MPLFDITAATNAVRLDAKGHGRNTFTVSNASGRPLRARAELRAKDPAQQPWISLEGEAERDFPIDGTHQFVGRIEAPAGTAPGTYSCRLNVVSVENPDDDFAEGPSVSFEVRASELTTKRFPWWIPVAALILIAVGVGAWWLLSGPPDVVGLDVNEAETKLAEAKYELGTVTKRFTGLKQPGTVLDQKLGDDEKTINLVVEPYLLATNNLDPDPLGGFRLAVEVPDFKGQDQRQARLRMRDLNLMFEAVLPEGLGEAGKIVSQTPAAGAVVEPAEMVLVVSLSKPPDGPSKRDLFQNASVGAASRTLQSPPLKGQRLTFKRLTVKPPSFNLPNVKRLPLFNKTRMFDGDGVCFGSERGNTLFADGQPKGKIHFVEWSTKTPVNVEGLRLFAAHDTRDCRTSVSGSQKAISRFSFLSKLNKGDEFEEVLKEDIRVPYQFVRRTQGLIFERDSLAVKAQYFRAEFTQFGSTQFSGPRIMELDGFGGPVEQ